MRIVINNGLVIDPKNSLYAQLNVAIEDGKIKEVTEEYLTGDVEIDATGLCVSPGFIDMHIHEDPIIDGNIKRYVCQRMLKMGVTTAIGGSSGVGRNDPKEYLDFIDKGNPINFGLLLPHGFLRKSIGATDNSASLENSDIEKMYKLGKKYMKEAGLFGVSFGLRYIPGVDFNELITISKLAENKLVAGHLRDDAKNAINATKEFLQIGDYVKAHLQVTHIGSLAAYGYMEEFLDFITARRNEGVDVSCNSYPYTAFSMKIGASTFDEGFIERYNARYFDIEVAEGEHKGKRCTEELFKEIRETAPETLLIAHVMKEDGVEKGLLYPHTVLASDAVLGISGDGHPRAAGTFPRFIKKYVKDKKVISLYDAVEKMTYAPAKILGIDKGSLSIGSDADITIFSFEDIEDRATFKNPDLAPIGISYVLINGEIALENDEIVNDKLGKALRKF